MTNHRHSYFTEPNVIRAGKPSPVEEPRQPRKPDWLMLLVVALFLLTLLIAWLTDVPVMFR